jgi:protein TonB
LVQAAAPLNPLLRDRRLAFALAVSLVLHGALLLWPAAPTERPGAQAGLPLLARLAEAPAPMPASRPQGGKGERQAAAQRRAPQPAGVDDLVARRRRTASTIVMPAAGEVGEDLQAARLSARQRAVPRSESMAAPAEPLRPIAARYPREALARGLRGHVLVEAIIGTRGSAVEVIVIDDQDRPELGLAAVQAVRRARFRPARDEAGAPMRSRVALRVEFSFE